MDYVQLTAEKQWQFTTASVKIGDQTFSDSYTTISGVNFAVKMRNLSNF